MMLAPFAGLDLSGTLLGMALLASCAVMPALAAAYGRQWLAAQKVRPLFSLRRSEVAELDRALRLHAKVCRRLNEIENRAPQSNGLWRAVFAFDPDANRDTAEEREDLQAHACHLRATIARLRALPLRSLTDFVRTVSLRSALGWSLGAYVTAFALMVLGLPLWGWMLSAQALMAAPRDLPVFLLFDRTLVEANAAAAGMALILAPLFYLLRRARFRREFALEFCVLTDLAAATPDQKIYEPHLDPSVGDAGETPKGRGPDANERWFSILGVSQSAEIGEVREAYRKLIRQNHPDRVQDMSPAIREIAEAETKRLNAAYREALALVS